MALNLDFALTGIFGILATLMILLNVQRMSFISSLPFDFVIMWGVTVLLGITGSIFFLIKANGGDV